MERNAGGGIPRTGRQIERVTDAAAPVSVLNLAVAAGLEDEATFIALSAERIGDQLDALGQGIHCRVGIAAQVLRSGAVLDPVGMQLV